MSREAVDRVLTDLIKLGKIDRPRRSGRKNIIFDCPFHSKGKRQSTPSFGVHTETGEWNCFNPMCGRKGPSVHVLRSLLTGEPLEEVQAAFPVDLGATDDLRRKLSGEDPDLPRLLAPYPFTAPIKVHLDAVSYMQGRNIPEDVWTKLGLEYCPAERIRSDFGTQTTITGRRIIFPIRMDGPRGFMGRSIYKDPMPKFRPIENLGQLFYDPMGILDDPNAPREVTLVEGEFSLAACIREGLPTLGCFGSSIGRARVHLLDKFERIVMFFDGDKAGRQGQKNAFAEHGREFGKRLMSIDMPEGMDPATLPVGFGKAVRARLDERMSFSDTLKRKLYV